MKRIDGREAGQLRKIKIVKDFLTHPEASALVEFGGTKVVCSVSVTPGVPPWMRAQNVPGGWLTSEYGMIPGSTHQRGRREASSGKPGGRTMEIQRLVGRSLRSVVDLMALGPNTVYVDCDVIDADGGTRCASVTGASVALWTAFQRMLSSQRLTKFPMRENLAAVSVGVLKGEPILDLCYEEDSNADVDMNIVMTHSGRFVEIQGTAEAEPFSQEMMLEMIGLARKGLTEISAIQDKIVEAGSGGRGKSKGRTLGDIGEILEQGKE